MPEIDELQAKADASLRKISIARSKMHEKLAKLGVEIAIASVEGKTDRAAILGRSYLKQLEEMAKGG